jgi:streptogramin lyase
LYQYNLKDDQLKLYPTFFSRKKLQGFTALHADRSDTLWLTSRDGNLYSLSPDRQRFVRYPFEGGLFYNSLAEDNQGRIWVIGQEKIAFFDRTTETFTYYRYKMGDSTGLPDPAPIKIFTTRKGTLLITTQEDRD